MNMLLRRILNNFKYLRENDLLKEVHSIIFKTEHFLKIQGDDFSFSSLREYNEVLYHIIDSCLKDEMKGILVLSHLKIDVHSTNEYDNPLAILLLFLESPFRFSIAWDQNTSESLLNDLSDMFEHAAGLNTLRERFHGEPSLWEVYNNVSDSYFPQGVTLSDWQSGDFQESAIILYSDGASRDLVQSYIRSVDDLLRKYKKIPQKKGI